MATRTGIPKIVKIAKALCLAVTFFAPTIRKVTNNDPAVEAALAAALAACTLLEQKLEPYLPPGD